MKMFKKAMSVLIAVIMVFGTFSTAYASEANVVTGTCGEHLTWTINKSIGYLHIQGNGAMYDYDFDNEAPWKDYYDILTYVILDEGVTTVGEFAFDSMRNVDRADLPSTLTSIGDWSFYGSGLATLVVPEGVVSIGYSAFASVLIYGRCHYLQLLSTLKMMRLGTVTAF